MYSNYFNELENEWLATHTEIKESIDYLLEDSQNVNTLDDGSEDVAPFLLAIQAAKTTIDVASKNLIKGPCNDNHFSIIANYFDQLHQFTEKQKKTFWELFTFHCACAFDEDEEKLAEQIYMEGLMETLQQVEEIDLLSGEGGNTVMNVNTNTIQQIVGEGANAKFR